MSAAFGVFGCAGGFSLGGSSARLGVTGLRVGLVAFVFGGAGAFERVVAVLLGLLGTRQVARGSVLGLRGGGLGGGLGGDGGLRARDRVLGATLGVFGDRLCVALSGFG